MPSHCSAYNCVQRRDEASKRIGITFHSFPKHKELRLQWARAVKRSNLDRTLWMPGQRDVLCSKHFKDADFDRTGQTVRLRPDTIPSIFDFPKRSKKIKAEQNMDVNSSQETDAITELKEPEEKLQDYSHISMDHAYAVPDPVELRQRVEKLNAHREHLEQQLHNCRRMEKRVWAERRPDFAHTGQTVQLRPDTIPSILDFPKRSKKIKAEQNMDVNSSQETDAITELKEPEEKLQDYSHISMDHAYAVPDPVELRQRIEKLNAHREDLEQQLHNCRRMEKRVRASCQSLLEELSDKNMLSAELQAKLGAYSDIPVELFEKPSQSYSEKQKDFALALYSHSSKAYEFLREDMKIPLPNPRTVCRWLGGADSSPGFSDAALSSLQELSRDSPQQDRLCSLVPDDTTSKDY